MASDNMFTNDRGTAAGSTAPVRETKRTFGLSLDAVTRKAAIAQHGSDPYNTSGSFDRKKNWSRVGKR